MARITIELPDDVRSQLESRATAGGFSSVELYARAVLQATAEDGLDDDAVEQLLVERSRTQAPDVEFTGEWAHQFRQQVRERREQAGQQTDSREARP